MIFDQFGLLTRRERLKSALQSKAQKVQSFQMVNGDPLVERKSLAKCFCELHDWLSENGLVHPNLTGFSSGEVKHYDHNLTNLNLLNNRDLSSLYF